MSWRLMVEDVGLLVVDAQEKLVVAITEPADWLARLGLLVQGAHLLGLPTVLTEQVPSKLGKTVSAIAKALGTGAKPIAKSQFSAAEAARSLGRKRILVAGCEAHICIRQTVYDLRLKEFTPVVVADAVGARQARDRDMALAEMRADGVVITTVEAVLFEMMESSTHPKFKEIQALIQ